MTVAQLEEGSRQRNPENENENENDMEANKCGGSSAQSLVVLPSKNAVPRIIQRAVPNNELKPWTC
jgi:hypothetical protein